jgi:hypothetical protein
VDVNRSPPIVAITYRGRHNRRLTVVLALAALLIASGCAGQPPGATTVQTLEVVARPPTPGATNPAAAPAPGSSVEPILVDSTCELVTIDEAEEALGEFVSGEQDFAAFGKQIDLTQPTTYSCRRETESDTYVTVGQGSAADFVPGAQVETVAGVPVPNLGDAAVWFADPIGTLAVREGNIHLRIVVNMPALDSAAQLAIARGLAEKALSRVP